MLLKPLPSQSQTKGPEIQAFVGPEGGFKHYSCTGLERPRKNHENPRKQEFVEVLVYCLLQTDPVGFIKQGSGLQMIFIKDSQLLLIRSAGEVRLKLRVLAPIRAWGTFGLRGFRV